MLSCLNFKRALGNSEILLSRFCVCDTRAFETMKYNARILPNSYDNFSFQLQFNCDFLQIEKKLSLYCRY